MNFLRNVYIDSLAENERQLQFWEDNLKQLKSLDFNVFCDKLKVPALIPIGGRILFRGNLIHTNEVTVALGADYFVKCSVTQADILRQHRISGAESKVSILKKEREHLLKQMNFNDDISLERQGHEIIEPYKEEEDLKWREHHRDNVRKYKQANKKRSSEEKKEDITDDELFNRLEELELQEELEEEYYSTKSEDYEDVMNNDDAKEIIISKLVHTEPLLTENQSKQNIKYNKENDKELFRNSNENSLNDMLHQALDRQNELEIKLSDLKNRFQGSNKSESDLILRLDEEEELDELEDEMNRLDDILYSEVHDEPNPEEKENNQRKRSVVFADDIDSGETLDITFTHSNTLPNIQPYDPVKGLTKPSDVYEAFPELYKRGKQSISILKETKYPLSSTHVEDEPQLSHTPRAVKEPHLKTQSIAVMKDVVEKKHQSNDITECEKRTPSLFKMRKLQKNK